MKRYVNRKMLFALLCMFASNVFANEKINLLSEAAARGINMYWDSLAKTGALEKNGHQISFRPGDFLVLLDNKKALITDAPSTEGGAVFVSKDFMEKAESFFEKENLQTSFRIGAVLIDPGHGGKDPGALQTFTIDGKKVTLCEKDLTLAVGKMLYEKMKRAYSDKQIILTRNSDVFLTLAERTDIANKVSLKDNEAIIYISIHINASLDKKANGYEVWYLSPGYRRTVIKSADADNDKTLFPILNAMTEEEYTTESVLIAKFIMDGLASEIGDRAKARGIKAEEWFVVKNAKMPSVLVELGFLTNFSEAKNLNDKNYLQKAASGIFAGMSDFIMHFERSRGFTASK